VHKKRTRIVEEIITTEKSYVKALNVLIQVFLEPLRTHTGVSTPAKPSSTDDAIKKEEEIAPNETNNILRKPTGSIDALTIKSIFSEIETIYGYNKLLLHNLETRMSEWSPNQVLSDIFLTMSLFLKSYQNYVNNYNLAMATLEKLQENDWFKKFQLSCQVQPVCAGLNLQSFLIMPIQRIPRYVLLLEDLVKATPVNHPDAENLRIAATTIRDIASGLNEAKRDADSINQVANIQYKIYGTFPSLMAPHRRYIREGDVSEVFDDGKVIKKRRILFMFNDLVVCAKQKKGQKYHFKFQFSFDQLTFESPPDIPGVKNSFKITTNVKDVEVHYWFMAPTMHERDRWIEEIGKASDELKKKTQTLRSNTVVNT